MYTMIIKYIPLDKTNAQNIYHSINYHELRRGNYRLTKNDLHKLVNQAFIYRPDLFRDVRVFKSVPNKYHATIGSGYYPTIPSYDRCKILSYLQCKACLELLNMLNKEELLHVIDQTN